MTGTELGFFCPLTGSLRKSWISLALNSNSVGGAIHGVQLSSYLVTRGYQQVVSAPRVYMREHQTPRGHGTQLLFSVSNECANIEFTNQLRIS